MFRRIGEFTVRRRRLVLIGSVLFVVVAALLGSGVFDRLSGGGFDDPSSESSTTRRVLEDEFGTGAPNLVLLVDARTPSSSGAGPAVDDPAIERAGTAIFDQLAARDDVEEV